MSGVEEMLSVMVCPLGVTTAVVKAMDALADGGPRSCFEDAVNSTSDIDETKDKSSKEAKFAFTALQVIVCLLARYHPGVLQLPGIKTPEGES